MLASILGKLLPHLPKSGHRMADNMDSVNFTLTKVDRFILNFLKEISKILKTYINKAAWCKFDYYPFEGRTLYCN